MHPRELLPDESLEHLGQLLEAVERAEAADLAYRDSARIHFLRNFTIEPIEPYVKFHMMRELMRPELSFGGYGTAAQEVLDEASVLHSDRPDVVVLALVLETLDSDYGRVGWRADNALTQVDDVLGLLLERTNTLLAVNTLLPPFTRPEGFVTTRRDTDAEVGRLNDHLRKLAVDNPGRLVLIDWQRLLRNCGRQDGIDARFWRMSQAPFKQAFLDPYSREIVKVLRALKGRAKKCLVLDCDNTLWGGIVGEAGVEGIQLDPTDWPGAAYYEFQRSVLSLHARGVLIALCSKNNEQDVWEVLSRHPHCLLDKSHLVTWRVDWNNKAESLASIADELNIGIDSLVFVDDNPRECGLVAQALPDVAVLQVPTALYDYPSLLFEDGLFDTLAPSTEDRDRTRMYQEEQGRRETRERFTDLTGYLASLGTIVRLREAEPNDIIRIAQLTQKTNQFNLTTQRYSEAVIRDYADRDDMSVIGMKVEDRYGDMGLSAVFIARREGPVGVVDTLLMSCRILGRELELAFVDHCLGVLEKRWDLREWRAHFAATKKNLQVASFWDRIGFEVVAEEDGRKQYTMTAGQRSLEYQELMSVEWE